MPRANSNDLRERVPSAVFAGDAVCEAGSAFGVNAPSATKWSKRLRVTGSAAPHQMGGYKPRVLASKQSWMLMRLEECPHLTVRGLTLELAERGYEVSLNTVWSLLRKAGYSFKRTLFAIEHDHPLLAARRA